MNKNIKIDVEIPTYSYDKEKVHWLRNVRDVSDLMICGGGPKEDELEEIIVEQDNIINVGAVSHDRVLKLIFYAEAPIFPSGLYEGIFQ